MISISNIMSFHLAYHMITTVWNVPGHLWALLVSTRALGRGIRQPHGNNTNKSGFHFTGIVGGITSDRHHRPCNAVMTLLGRVLAATGLKNRRRSVGPGKCLGNARWIDPRDTLQRSRDGNRMSSLKGACPASKGTKADFKTPEEAKKRERSLCVVQLYAWMHVSFTHFQIRVSHCL